MASFPITLRATLQDHRAVRESWAAATVLIHDLEGTADLSAVPPQARPGAEISAVGGRLGLAQPGQRLRLGGTFESTRYGLQLRVQQQISEGLTSPRDASRWLQRLDGVGPKLARALHERFGEQLVAVLSGEIEADLTQIHGISPRVDQHIRESYLELELSGDLETIRYLEEIGASRYESSKILEFAKKKRKKPKELLETEPYELTKVRGLGFVRVDRLARKAGCSPLAPARIEAAIMHTVNEIVHRGSTMAPLSGTRDNNLSAEATELLCLDGRDEVFRGVHRLAAKGDLILAEAEDGKTWVHPSWLLKAERRIYRAARGQVRRELRSPAKPREGEVGARDAGEPPPAAEPPAHLSVRQGVPAGGQAGEGPEAISPTPQVGARPSSSSSSSARSSPASVVSPLLPQTYRRRPGEAEPADLVPRLEQALTLTAELAAASTRAERVEALLGLLPDTATNEDW